MNSVEPRPALMNDDDRKRLAGALALLLTAVGLALSIGFVVLQLVGRM